MDLINVGTINKKLQSVYVTMDFNHKVDLNGYMSGRKADLIEMMEMEGRRILLIKKNNKIIYVSTVISQGVNSILFFNLKKPLKEWNDIKYQFRQLNKQSI